MLDCLKFKESNMPLTKAEQDKAIVAKLRLGFTPIEIKEMCEKTEGLTDYALSRIYLQSRNYKAVKATADIVPELDKIPIEVIQHVVDEAKTHTMINSPDEAKGAMLGALDAIIDGKKGLEVLNQDYQVTISNALSVFNTHLANPDLPLKDVKLIMDTISKSHMDIFSSTTNIHIGDNNTDNKKLSVFQNTMRS